MTEECQYNHDYAVMTSKLITEMGNLAKHLEDVAQFMNNHPLRRDLNLLSDDLISTADTLRFFINLYSCASVDETLEAVQ